MNEASTQPGDGAVAAASSPPSAAAHEERDPADDPGDPSPVDVAPEDRGEKWSDLRHKPVLQWTKGDWALWAGGPKKEPGGSSGLRSDLTEPETTLDAVGQPAGEEAHARRQEPLGEATAEVAPPREAPPGLRLEQTAAPELDGDPPVEVRAPSVQLPDSPPTRSVPTLPEPAPPELAPPEQGEEPRSRAPSGQSRTETKPAAARPPDRRSHTAAPPTRVRARIPSAMPATPLGSTIRLAALSIMVGVVLAGVITAALVVTAIALSRALG